MHEKGKQGRPYCPMLLINISSFLGLRLKLDEHSLQSTKILLICEILLLQQAKQWCRVLARKACFYKLFPDFFLCKY